MEYVRFSEVRLPLFNLHITVFHKQLRHFGDTQKVSCSLPAPSPILMECSLVSVSHREVLRNETKATNCKTALRSPTTPWLSRLPKPKGSTFEGQAFLTSAFTFCSRQMLKCSLVIAGDVSHLETILDCSSFPSSHPNSDFST